MTSRCVADRQAGRSGAGGQWCLPGGYIELEGIVHRYRATASAETGLDIRVQGIINVVLNRLDD